MDGQSSISDEADTDSDVPLHSVSCVPIESCGFGIGHFLVTADFNLLLLDSLG